MKKVNIGIVGATGLVGQTFIKVLEEYNIPVNILKLFASKKSLGKKLTFNKKEFYVEVLKEGCFNGLDFVLFSAGSKVSERWAPIAEKTGAYVIDNSSFWRMNEDCSLIVPEINMSDYKNKRKIISNPNCSTIQAVLPLKPLDEYYGINRIIFATYQSVSGSGQKGIDDYNNTKKGLRPKFYPYDIQKTCIPHIDSFLDNGYTKEEMKMANETKKILHNPNIKIASTCVRVPILFAHGVLIHIELNKKVESIEEVKNVIKKQSGIVLLDEPKKSIYPISTAAVGTDKVYVGRIRFDLSKTNGIILYCVADNVRKGAASNAIQILEKIIKENNK